VATMMSRVGTNTSVLHRVTIQVTGTRSHTSNSENGKALKSKILAHGTHEAGVKRLLCPSASTSHTCLCCALIFFMIFSYFFTLGLIAL